MSLPLVLGLAGLVLFLLAVAGILAAPTRDPGDEQHVPPVVGDGGASASSSCGGDSGGCAP